LAERCWQGPEDGWSSSYVVGALGAGAVQLAIFVAIELRVEAPLLDLRLFLNGQFTISSIVAVIGMFAFLGACFSTSMCLGPLQHRPRHGDRATGGPLALNSLPPGVPGAAGSQFALAALGSGFGQAFLVVAVAALVAALPSFFGLHGTRQADPEAEPSITRRMSSTPLGNTGTPVPSWVFRSTSEEISMTATASARSSASADAAEAGSPWSMP
jgi:hypothetical protein